MSGSATLEEAKSIIEDRSLAEEKLLEELENEDLDIPAHIREARFEELRKQAAQFEGMKDRHHGLYSDLKEEKEFLELTTTEERCVVHFYHVDFRRCVIMDKHLKEVAQKYFETKFARISVDTAKFFVTKLKIQVLPYVLCFKKGIVVDRIVGFEELGNTDSFTTAILERRLGQSGIIAVKGSGDAQKKPSTIFGFGQKKVDSDSDSDDY
ncbi:Thioredoxin domain-containing protein plp1 [Lamellibrachia satsuma]|nr:Thioredoxin domain-containing protein plp1 [Lamellibrachia satsuma]